MAEKTPKRLVRIKLPVELLEALEEMGKWPTGCNLAGVDRSLPSVIETSLKWAVWSWSNGRGPDWEMMADCQPGTPEGQRRGYSKWNEKLHNRGELGVLSKRVN
jgi:hypothetical protein